MPPAGLRSRMRSEEEAKEGEVGLVARVSRRVGAEGIAGHGQGSRSFNASGAPPGPLAVARSEQARRRDGIPA
jgi:hypothetical protein